ncbi:Hypothetical predicted protein [Cloeon dipterum]|uniref:cAMP-dependent protein kinase inhibitor n=1 Tax=Cloeon dipterum TaxID=197152 RepID=A0A8S1BRW6_9INSE|nr:Hypothetical predicted protein [Cloeon dipterum]
MTADNAIHDFLTTGRTGRRNAMPDILNENAKASTADLPEKLQALTCSTDKEGQPSTSSEGQTSQSQSNTSNSTDSSEKS